MSSAAEILGNVTAAYNSIHDAVNAALTHTNDQGAVSMLLSEYNAARGAYSSAMNAALNPDEPSLMNLMGQLSTASQAIADTKESANDTERYLSKIGTAVGVLAKVAALVA